VQPDAALFRMLAKSCEFGCENLDKDRTEDLGLAASLPQFSQKITKGAKVIVHIVHIPHWLQPT
jgi:hypothetical protein